MEAVSGAPDLRTFAGVDFTAASPLISRIIYVVENDIGAQPSTPLKKLITTITQAFQEVQKKQDDIALYLYGFSAQKDKVEKTYAQWKDKLDKLSTRLTEVSNDMKEVTEKLPFIDDQELLSTSFHSLLVLLVQQHQLSQRNNLFLACLKEPTYEYALQECKTMIRQAEDILATNKSLSSITLVVLAPIVTQLVETITKQREHTVNAPTAVKNCIAIVHKQAVRFFRYCIDKLKMPDSKATQEAEFRAKLLRSLESTFDFTEGVQEITDGIEELSLENSQVALTSSSGLQSNRYFRHGSWLTKQRYPKIYPSIAKLQRIAKAIQDCEESQLNRICSLTKAPDTDVQGDIQTLKALRSAVEKERAELHKLEFSKEIHAGFYYGRELLSLLDERTYMNTLLTQLANEPFKRIAVALNNLLDFIESDPTGNSLKDLAKLFELAQAIERASFIEPIKYPFVKDVCQTYINAMKIVFARAGKKLLAHDTSHPATLFADSNQDGEALLCYIAKECLKYGYFDKKQREPEFNLRLHSCTHPVFTEALQSNSAFSQIYQSYKIKNLIDPAVATHQESLRLIFRHIDALASKEKEIDLDNRSIEEILLYVAAQSWLLEIPIGISYNSSEQLQTLLTIARERLTRAAKLRNYPQYCMDFAVQDIAVGSDRELYHLLRKALWAEKGKIRESAKNSLEKLLENTPHTIHNDPVIQTLLDQFYIRKAKNNQIIEEYELLYILTLLTRYVSLPFEQNPYGQAFGSDEMEMLLYQSIKVEEEPSELTTTESSPSPVVKLFHAIYYSRGNTGYTTWKEVMSAYNKLKNYTPEQLLTSQSYHTLFHANADSSEQNRYKPIFTYFWNKIQIRTQREQ